MDSSWIVALFGALVGSLITILATIIRDKINRSLLRERLIKYLAIEVSTYQPGKEVEFSNIPTVISHHLLLTGILDPINDNDLIKYLLQYLVLAKDVDKSLIVGTPPGKELEYAIVKIKDLITKG